MMKQPPYVTKLRLSKLCRWLIALGVIKLTLFAAMVTGVPVPELRFDAVEREELSSAPSTRKPVAVRQFIAPVNVRTAERPEDLPAPASPAVPPASEPQGSAAAAAAAAAKPLSKAALPDLLAAATAAEEARDTAAPAETVNGFVPEPAPLPASVALAAPDTAAAGAPDDGTSSDLLLSGVDGAAKPRASEEWWRNILKLDRLPVPRLGTERVAHAAALDTPPSPTIPATSGASPFTPPAQQIPRGQGADGEPLPPRSTTARPLPAGTSLPSASGMAPAALPAPQVNEYVPPENPNRQKEELERQEREILLLKQQMEQRLQELRSAEQKVQGMLEQAKGVESGKVSGLVSMYANMKPKSAARALEAMDEGAAARILFSLKPKMAGEILSYMDSQKAAKLSEMSTHMRLPQ